LWIIFLFRSRRALHVVRNVWLNTINYYELQKNWEIRLNMPVKNLSYSNHNFLIFSHLFSQFLVSFILSFFVSIKIESIILCSMFSKLGCIIRHSKFTYCLKWCFVKKKLLKGWKTRVSDQYYTNTYILVEWSWRLHCDRTENWTWIINIKKVKCKMHSVQGCESLRHPSLKTTPTPWPPPPHAVVIVCHLARNPFHPFKREMMCLEV